MTLQPASTRVAVADNADAAELARFSELSHQWWDATSELFAPLHAMNPLRLTWVERVCGGLRDKDVLDVGCGGGILSEAMATRGARVLGIDLADRALGVARLHRLESGVQLDYRLVSVEALAEELPAHFDVITCMEMLEHVPRPESIVEACGRLLKPGGIAVFSTISRNSKAYVYAILGAEYLLRLLPRGTHDYARFLRPAEIARFGRASGMLPIEISGMRYNPLTRTFHLTSDTSVNYLIALGVMHA
ncbi:MAG: bifunctional 2-polyprenyl-6-hydroxyphenol methylase/3-demethylubiquinol 3-O-methyltransferase UbiG [Pseudomonadota bacterium]|nr:bifunctional 2-polyprenyl-6-hydroxyphenol methylase/3-demethylubiquinol 3-O-methyltransferase UbiG [Pseudomonadota bacterium]